MPPNTGCTARTLPSRACSFQAECSTCRSPLATQQNVSRRRLAPCRTGCLSNVIYALTDDKGGGGAGGAGGGAGRHVPYRDSKLTRVLQDSLVSKGTVKCQKLQQEAGTKSVCACVYVWMLSWCDPGAVACSCRAAVLLCFSAAYPPASLCTVAPALYHCGPRSPTHTHLPHLSSSSSLPLPRPCLQGGTARTVLIICCSPCAENSAETLSSLRFGARWVPVVQAPVS